MTFNKVFIPPNAVWKEYFKNSEAQIITTWVDKENLETVTLFRTKNKEGRESICVNYEKWYVKDYPDIFSGNAKTDLTVEIPENSEEFPFWKNFHREAYETREIVDMRKKLAEEAKKSREKSSFFKKFLKKVVNFLEI